MKHYPLIAPQPPRLSNDIDALRAIEDSGVYSNFGPVVRGFERDINDQMFGGVGASMTVANATLGLMIAIRHAAGNRPRPGGYALMPSLTFAATAHAAEWAGLTPLICDIDADDWGACARREEQLLADLGNQIAVIVPYATFGNAIDLDRYADLQRRYGVGVVVDAAASLGTINDDGSYFGSNAPFPVVYSLHATKTFAVAEGGLIHAADADLIEQLRLMANFGFGAYRSATMPGLNAKMPEVIGLMASRKLADIEAVCAKRAAVEEGYRAALSDYTLQAVRGRRRASQFMPLLLPENLAACRLEIVAALAERHVGSGQYFSPHLAEQRWFRQSSRIEPTPVADAVALRMLSLPITDDMTAADAAEVADRLDQACRVVAKHARRSAQAAAPGIASVVVIGGGPAGTALLTAASKRAQLADLAASGLVVVERDDALGGGMLSGYAITSDSTAQTFLTAVRNNPYPDIGELADHPVAHAVDRYADALGVPLAEVGPLLHTTGERLGRIAAANGAQILTGHEAVKADQLPGGLWRVSLRRRRDGRELTQLTRSLVIATGGHQPIDRLATQRVAGASLLDLAGERLLQSDDVLRRGGMDRVADLLSGKHAPRIAVIGGSTSALATVTLLLKRQPALPFGAGAITLLHRRPLRPFYHSAEAALADGFSDFGPEDICPVSGFVYRLAGFRLEARELVLRMLQVGGRVPDPRLHTHRIADGADPEAQRILREADLVIGALGYRPYALPLYDQHGAPIALAAHGGAPMVDPHCRVVDAEGAPIGGVYGIGLAAGFVPWGALGGEASFRGQANGLWLWQNDVGQMIIDQVLADRAQAVA